MRSSGLSRRKKFPTTRCVIAHKCAVHSLRNLQRHEMRSATEKVSLWSIRTLCYTKRYMNFNFSKYLRQHLVIRETVTGNWSFVRMTLYTCHRNLERGRPILGVNKSPLACQIRPSINFKPIHDNMPILQQMW